MTPDISRPIHLFGHYSVLGPIAMVLRFLYFDRFGSIAGAPGDRQGVEGASPLR